MAELTIDQALQQAVEAHKAGQVQEADRLYTAILKAQPKHPDANHNMGVLAVGVGKVQEALPFFKTALEANPATAQFWLSYIDTLIKLGKLADGKAVLDQAKSKGAKGDGFDKLEQRLQEANKECRSDDTLTETSETNHSSTLDIAIQFRETGEFDQAIDLLKDEIKRFPKDADMLALLSHCYLLAEQVEDAKLYLDKAKKIAPENASVGWNTARLTLKEKNPLDALNIARDTSQKFPDDVEGMGVLGACLRANGEMVESLEVLNKAIELNPDYAEALINRGLIRLSRENKPEALADLELAHRLKPHIKQIWDLVISLKVEVQDYSDAILLLINMIEIDPNWEKGFSLLAACNQKADDSALAVKSFEKVLEVKPGSAAMHVNLGIALTKQGETKTAIANFNKALAIKPDYADAHNNMGVTLKEQGKLEEAIEAYNKALVIKPDYAEAYNNMGNALKGITFKKPNPDLQKTITSLLDKKRFVRPSNIACAAISLLKFEPKLKRHLQTSSVAEPEPKLLEAVTDLSELLLKLMSVCPLPDLALENLIRELRASLLLSISDLTGSTAELKFQSALALQCFTNEYIYNQSEHEDKALTALAAASKQTLNNGDQPSPQSILCLASYKPLNQYKWASSLRITNEIEDVFTRQVVEPNQESQIKTTLPVLEAITDKVSSKVRDQYEVSPYPRWVNTGLRLKPAPISKLVEEIKLKLLDNKITKAEAPNILIAGCGTGQHSIGTAARFKGSKIIAIDLSLSSLSYAKRKTEELDIQNIDYMQADILNLGNLGRQFDIVESSGVLHHMDDPVAGWRVLTDCLKPGGLMKIGLYSELARQHIVEIRQEISRAGIGSSDVAMKSFRAKVMRSDQSHHKQILNSRDFYSLSTLKDLLFHVQEHRFTIPQIRDCLSKLGLKFCGFESEKIVSHFKQTNTGADDPYELDKWQAYEEANPSAFAGMYQFWCQKVA
ncbi:tetratricopeptide repeat protein [Planktomarina temperata]|nr:tetratricopeptide repeat protein [Planktomarina temperata]